MQYVCYLIVLVLQRVTIHVTPHCFEKQKYDIKAAKVVL